MSGILVSIQAGPAADELLEALASAGHTASPVSEERLDGVVEVLQIALPVVTPAVAFVLGRYFAFKTAVAQAQPPKFELRTVDGMVLCVEGESANRLVEHLMQQAPESSGDR